MSRDSLRHPNYSRESSAEDFNASNKPEAAEGNLGDKIVDVTSRVKERAGQMADKVAETVDKQRENAAGGLDRAAFTLHQKADELPGGRTVTQFTHTIADGMESAAQYLRDADFDEIKDSVLETCRKYPAQTLIGALAVGFLVGRAIRR
jgi:hypothetical protein